MRLIKFLNEKVHLDPDELREKTKEIEKSCQKFISDVKRQSGGEKKHVLWSGRKNLYDDISIKTVRKDRRPKDTAPFIQEMLDDAFQDKFGIRPRSESIFCIPDTFIPEQNLYGTLFSIFPIGNYKLIYSDKVADIFEDIFSLFMKEEQRLKFFKYQRVLEKFGKNPTIDNLEYFWKRFVDSEQRWQLGGIDTFVEWIQSGEAEKEMRNYLKKLVGEYESITGKDLQTIKPNEIMLYCDKVYAIKFSVYKDVREIIFGDG